MPFSTDDLENLRQDLAQLPQNRPKCVSNRDAVAALRFELAKALNLGYSVDDLAQLLSGKGLRMTAGTLKGYLQQARKKKRPNKKSTTTGNPGSATAATAGSTSAPATSAGQSASAPSLPAPAKPAPHTAGEPRPTEPAVGKGAPAVPPLPAPAARRP